MNQFEQHREAIDQVRTDMPSRCEGEPLFYEPWHARIFALMVILVKDRKLEWRQFQERLVHHLREHQSSEANLDAEEIHVQYFHCWLEAAEETLSTSGFVDEHDIIHQIEAIRYSVEEIRRQQLKAGH